MKRTKYKYSGKTSTRPDNLTTNDIGYEYFDIEKNIVSFWNGTEWIELSPESQEELVVLSPENGEASMTLASLHSIVITENTTINLPDIEEEYWETKLYVKGQEGNVVTLKEGDITNEIELGCNEQHVLKIVRINGEFYAELVDYSPEGSGEEEEEELKEVSVADNNLQLLDCPIQICNNLVDNTTILLPNLIEEYKEVKLIFSTESDLDLILSDGEDTLSITSSTGVKELLIKKVFGEWSIVLIDLR